MGPVDHRLRVERRAVLQQQPNVKWINVIENDGGNVPKVKRHLVKMHQTPDMDYLKAELTDKLTPQWGMVRNLYTPAGGTVVNKIDELQADKAYVVGGVKFKPVPGISLRAKEQEKEQRKKKRSLARSEADAREEARKSWNSNHQRISLLDRQNMIARMARESKEQSGVSDNNSSTQGSAETERRSNGRVVKRRRVAPANRISIYDRAAHTNREQSPPSQARKVWNNRSSDESRSGSSKKGRSLSIPSHKASRSKSRDRKKEMYNEMFDRRQAAQIRITSPDSRHSTSKSNRRDSRRSSPDRQESATSERSDRSSRENSSYSRRSTYSNGSERSSVGGSNQSSARSNDSRYSRASRASKKSRNSRYAQSSRSSRGSRDSRDSHGSRDSRDSRNSRDSRDSRGSIDSRDSRDSRASSSRTRSAHSQYTVQSKRDVRTGDSRRTRRSRGSFSESMRESTAGSGISHNGDRDYGSDRSSLASARSDVSRDSRQSKVSHSGHSQRRRKQSSGSANSSYSGSRTPSAKSKASYDSRRSGSRTSSARSYDSRRSGSRTPSARSYDSRKTRSAKSDYSRRTRTARSDDSRRTRSSGSRGSQSSRTSSSGSERSYGSARSGDSRLSGSRTPSALTQDSRYSGGSRTPTTRTRHRRSVVSKKSARSGYNSEEVQDGYGSTDVSRQHSQKTLRNGRQHSKDESTRSHRFNVRSAGQGRMNNSAPAAISAYGRSKSVFSYKSGGNNSAGNHRTVEVDYDQDPSGLYRAHRKIRLDESQAHIVLDSTITKIDTPIDYQVAQEVDEDVRMSRRMRKMRI